MKKLFAAVAVAALALTSAAPVVHAADRVTQIQKTSNPSVVKAATSKPKKKTASKAAKPAAKKKVTKAAPAGTPKKA
jgi:hypothetical protein